MPIIHLEMLSGRTHQQKSELAEALTRETARIARCAISDVQVVINEVDRSLWAVGGALGAPAPASSAEG
ncbi:tautomerase family protein [Burkholderia sp. Ac-20353]|uniref:tautomerase family protein n=1 Tax=Burkholderia sp. Ac-20353 TaxID=2703894 RepID=UPI00197BF24D|nr:tautomerase family protein [Burkholderia sp. Ac-20353]MBN3787314.1 4-oxalocrotonate tautomerase [Burkholderia sp. Ac-20353]